MAKSKEKIRALKLRKEGESIKRIASILNVSVSSVSFWCKNVILTEDQITNLALRKTSPYFGKRKEYLLKKKKEFDEKVFLLKKEGIKLVGKLSKRDVFLIGVALYWGEGFKKDHLVGLASSDIEIAKFFIFWLKDCFNIQNKELILRVTANISYKNKIKQLTKHWSDELKIPLNQFSKPYFQKTKWKKEYENKNEYYGVLRIKARKSINLLRKIFGFIEGIAINIEN